MSFFTSEWLDLKMFLIIALSIPSLMALIRGAPFVPTPMNRSKKMLELAKVKQGEKLYDWGCGDGRTVYLAANMYEAKAVGIELSPLVYFWALIRKVFWRSHAVIRFGNFWWQNFRDADVITFYLLPDMMPRVAKKLEEELKFGSRVVSYAFPIKSWQPVYRLRRNRKKGFCPVWVYEMGISQKN